MNAWLATAVTVAAMVGGGAASAADVEIRNVAARVVVTPEARNDVQVTISKFNPRLQVHISRVGDDVIVDGRLGLRNASCRNLMGRKGVSVWGVGFVPYDELPVILVRTPTNVKVRAGKAVYGVIGRANSAELDNAGCGDWTLADVSGPVSVRLAGSGDVRAGNAGSADVRISGSADATFNSIRNGLTSATSGSGDLRAATVDGPLHVRVAGSGDVIAHGGQVTDMSVSVAGSGDVRFAGVAQTLQASIAGSGDVSVGHVTGPVSKHVAGSGSVTVGS